MRNPDITRKKHTQGVQMLADERLLDGIVEVLEPNAMYYNGGKDDDERYFIDGGALELLGLLLTTVILPTLTNVLSDDLKERLKKWRSKREAAPAFDLSEGITQASSGPAPSPEAKAAAAAAAAAVLQGYGWPASAAAADAGSVVIHISLSIWTEQR